MPSKNAPSIALNSLGDALADLTQCIEKITAHGSELRWKEMQIVLDSAQAIATEHSTSDEVQLMCMTAMDKALWYYCFQGKVLGIRKQLKACVLLAQRFPNNHAVQWQLSNSINYAVKEGFAKHGKYADLLVQIEAISTIAECFPGDVEMQWQYARALAVTIAAHHPLPVGLQVDLYPPKSHQPVYLSLLHRLCDLANRYPGHAQIQAERLWVAADAIAAYTRAHQWSSDPENDAERQSIYQTLYQLYPESKSVLQIESVQAHSKKHNWVARLIGKMQLPQTLHTSATQIQSLIPSIKPSNTLESWQQIKPLCSVFTVYADRFGKDPVALARCIKAVNTAMLFTYLDVRDKNASTMCALEYLETILYSILQKQLNILPTTLIHELHDTLWSVRESLLSHLDLMNDKQNWNGVQQNAKILLFLSKCFPSDYKGQQHRLQILSSLIWVWANWDQQILVQTLRDCANIAQSFSNFALINWHYASTLYFAVQFYGDNGQWDEAQQALVQLITIDQHLPGDTTEQIAYASSTISLRNTVQDIRENWNTIRHELEQFQRIRITATFGAVSSLSNF